MFNFHSVLVVIKKSRVLAALPFMTHQDEFILACKSYKVVLTNADTLLLVLNNKVCSTLECASLNK